MLKSKYGDIHFKTINDIKEISEFFTANNADIKSDYFSFYAENYNNAEIFYIMKNQEKIGFISLYNIDTVNNNANIYGFTKEKMRYSDLVKSIISLMIYAFDDLKLNKLSFIYREDNYFFDDICRHLKFINEGILRNQLFYDKKYYNLCIYSILEHEFSRLITDDYRKMYAWNYDFNSENFIQTDINNYMNIRAFSNNLINSNNANLNDLREFVLNKEIPTETCLKYKNINFNVNIFDESKRYDNIACAGQEIQIEENYYTALLVVTMAQFGYQKSNLTLVYEDGSSEINEFNVSDWCERILQDEYIIHYASGCRNLRQGVNIIKGDSFILLKKIEADSAKKLKNIILPDNKDINIFALGGCCVGDIN